MEKWTVFIPDVEASVPVLDAGRSSARRNPVWELKMEESLRERG
jgi:hypothetical protein